MFFSWRDGITAIFNLLTENLSHLGHILKIRNPCCSPHCLACSEFQALLLLHDPADLSLCLSAFTVSHRTLKYVTPFPLKPQQCVMSIIGKILQHSIRGVVKILYWYSESGQFVLQNIPASVAKPSPNIGSLFGTLGLNMMVTIYSLAAKLTSFRIHACSIEFLQDVQRKDDSYSFWSANASQASPNYR